MNYRKLLLFIITNLIFFLGFFAGRIGFSIQVLAQTCGGVQCPSNTCGPVTGSVGGYWGSETCSLYCTNQPNCNESNPGLVGENCTDSVYGGDSTSICFPTCQSNGTGCEGCVGGNSYCVQNCDGYGCYQTDNVTIWCCDTPTTTPAPTSTPGGGGGGGGDGSTPTPTPVRYFGGNIYEDAAAVPGGIGGTDNLCVGSTSTLVNATSSTVNIARAGESEDTTITGAYYSIIANTNNDDYTVSLELPFPPTDPDNPLQCACNADPTNPYRCVYTNQQPNQGVTNFFVKTGSAINAWFQTLGGSSWASGNILSRIPFATCTPPTCIPALIGRDPAGTVDSAGFPLTDTGEVATSDTGGVYIHESDGRSNAVQAQALGVSVPVENYEYFFGKFGEQADILPNAGKPIVGNALAIYRYNGDLIIDDTNPWNLANTEQVIVFVTGDLTLDDTPSGENRITSVATGGDGFLMFIVNGAITVTADVGYDNIYTDPTDANIANVEGVFIADGMLTIAGQTSGGDRKFIGAGTFVGWTGVDLQRNFDDGSTPELNEEAATEIFIFRPDFIINAPREVKSAQMTWREVEPSF